MSVTVYKLVHVTPAGRRTSWNLQGHKDAGDRAIRRKDPLVVAYTNKKFTVPRVRGTPLWAFDTLEAARYKASNSFDTEIWECEADIAVNFMSGLFRGISLFDAVKGWRALWKGWRKRGAEMAEKGIVLCGRIKLKRCVKAVDELCMNYTRTT